ncbi:MAG TPA: adenylate/guanylate cyclase domain-containing protein, partial [Candidatus Binatia bacterium]|nr:adenylate/guanylate cyclase domain-containing protein [Candidatus Binatia bacterium]
MALHYLFITSRVTSTMDERSERLKLEQSIATLEAQRAMLGDEVVDVAVAALRARLAALAPQAQRKQVTVLFAAVPAFAVLDETIDAEVAGAAMNALWHRLDRLVAQHGGQVDKHMGDALMAVWGMRTAREDDPEQAIRAALQMQQAISDWKAEVLPASAAESANATSRLHKLALYSSISVHVGINTGDAFLGKVGTTGEYTAIGDTVNVAARLEAAAPADGVLISHDTYRHVRGVFAVQEQASLHIEGRPEPVRTYRVGRVKPHPFRVITRAVEGIETRTIGRDKELARLQTLFRDAIGQSRTTLVTIVGEAGVGKSRLLYEFDNWLELLPQQLWYFKARATPHMANFPYHLLRTLLTDRFKIHESDPVETVWEKMEAGVATFLASNVQQPDEEIVMRAHVLGAMLGYDFHDSPYVSVIGADAEQLRNRALLYLEELFNAAAEQLPLVILLEDIHWADGPSLTALRDLLRRAPDLPLMVVTVARPALFEREPEWGRNHERLDLQPLSDAACRRLVHEILQKVDEIPDALCNMIVARAEGNPFFVEELVKMLIDDGIILPHRDRWLIRPVPLAELRVPATLTGVLQARLDRLPAAEKRALQYAAVAGRVFWNAQVLHLAKGRLRPDHLHSLQQRELIYPRSGETAFTGMTAFVFKHNLLRDVAYESIPRRTRQVYHARAAEWLRKAAAESGRTDEYAPLIAEHYEQAGHTEEARAWYGRAGRQAAVQFAHAEAAHWLSRTLELTPDTETGTRFELLLVREKVYDVQGDRQAQAADLASLAGLAAELPMEQQTVVALRRAHFANVSGDYDGAIAYAQQAIDLARIPAHAADAHRRWGNALWRQGRFEEARARYETALAQARAIEANGVVADSLRGLGTVAKELGSDADARAYFEESLQLARVIGDHRSEAACLTDLGMLEQR